VQHKTLEDAWICINGVVYDMTQYVPKHPGKVIIMKGAGTEATALFSRYI